MNVAAVCPLARRLVLSGMVLLGSFPAARGAEGPASRPADVPGRQVRPIPAFWKSSLADVEQAVAAVRKGKVQVLAESAGGRKIHLVSYGAARELKSQATYSSALGAGSPAWYAHKPPGTPPAVLLLGPVHGQELEGVAGMVNLIHLVETGKDLRGRAWPGLTKSVERCRVLIVPCANPDGRARVALDSFIGESLNTYEYYGMGTTADGRVRNWPRVKRRQPMVGDVGFLGGYFNDAGVNLMHDDWFGRMAPENAAILDLARREAVDYGLSLHSHGGRPAMYQTDFMAPTCQEKLILLSERVSRRFAAMKHRLNPIDRRMPSTQPAGQEPESFNLCSALHQVCGGAFAVYENASGIPGYHKTTHEEILDLQMALFEELMTFAAENPVVWKR